MCSLALRASSLSFGADDGELDLEGIQPGSLLEACAFLGAMRTTGYELSTVDKKSDVWMKVPMMATSRLVQRMVEVKSAAKTAALQAEVEALKQKIALLEVSASGQGKGGDVRHVDAEAAEAAEA